MNAIAPIAVAYLLGALPFGLLVGRLAGIGDIRKQGSGNIGATNVWRLAGFKVAIWVFIGDIGKGSLAVMVARFFVSSVGVSGFRPDYLYVICAAAAVIGHVFPVYLGFRGGKGVNTALGAIAALLPLETAISFVIFLVVVSLSRYVSLGSMLGAVGFCAVVMIERFVMESQIENIYVYLSILIVLLILFTHRQNIARLVNGTENKFSFSSKSRNGADSE